MTPTGPAPDASDDYMMARRKLVGVIGSGAMGRSPFDRKSWSGISFHFFGELRRRGLLHRAFGVEVNRPERYLLMARNFRWDRKVWRRQFYLDVNYRDALSGAILRKILDDDLNHDFLQIGGMYDVPRILEGRTRCYLYTDGNLAVSGRNPFASRRISPATIDRALDFERRVYNGQEKVLTMSEYLRNSFIEDFGLAEDRVVNIGGAINLETIPDQDAAKRYDSQELLFVGVEFERKGGWILLEAFQRARRRFPRAVLHIVGPSRLRVPPRLEGGVVFHGFLSKAVPEELSRMKGLLERCILFVMPSLYEPFGIAPLEAMAHQIPCLVSDGWALREVVLPGQNGQTVAIGSADDLEAKIVSLLSDPGALQSMGHAGRELVLRQFTWERVVDRLSAALLRSG
jgi:glycosyltransferase involved in cell wall biosynthesis